jgi:hypothetical protein
MNHYDYDSDATPGWKSERNRIVTQRVRTPDPALQLPLPTAPERPSGKEDLTIGQRFSEWCDANPGVLGRLRQMALDRVAAGEGRISTKALIEDLRRAPDGVVAAGEQYRINNVFSSRIARVLATDVRLAGYIETRRLTAA